MPVFVEWRWQETTNSFLVIFHFYDDFSKPNLRITKSHKKRGSFIQHFTQSNFIVANEAWMTWSPSHPEITLLSELLSYANIINGLKEYERRKLKPQLEGVKIDRISKKSEAQYVNAEFLSKQIGGDKKFAGYIQTDDPQNRLPCCVELCPEYIDSLRKVLKPYLK